MRQLMLWQRFFSAWPSLCLLFSSRLSAASELSGLCVNPGLPAPCAISIEKSSRADSVCRLGGTSAYAGQREELSPNLASRSRTLSLRCAQCGMFLVTTPARGTARLAAPTKIDRLLHRCEIRARLPLANVSGLDSLPSCARSLSRRASPWRARRLQSAFQSKSLLAPIACRTQDTSVARPRWPLAPDHQMLDVPAWWRS